MRVHENKFVMNNFSSLSRAPLGYFYNAPHWGGGYFEPPPLISETTGPILKFKRHSKALEQLSKENKF